MQFTVDIAIAAPPAAVWPIMADVERWPEWTPSISHVTRLTGGPFAEGSRVRVKQPRLLAADWTVSRLEPGRRFTWTTTSVGVAVVGDHRIEPDGAGSRVVLTLDFGGPLGGLVGRLAGGLTRRYMQMEASGLKRRVESGRPPPAVS